MTSPGVPSQTDIEHAATSRCARSRWSSASWLRPLLVIVTLMVLALFRGPDASGQIPLAVRWLLVALLGVAAWTCPPRFVIPFSLAAIVGWSWIEVGTATSFVWLPGHLVRLIVAMGLVASVVKLRERLASAQQLARVDSLTGLPNRAAVIEAIEAELSRAKRFRRPFSLAMLDCDGFKQLNDQRGHLVGDEALRCVGQTLREQTRPFDCAGRWGGDEFLIVLSEVDHDDAQLVAERLRAAMRHSVERGLPTLKFSLGIVTVRQADLDWEECVRRADAAMYDAKRRGPDQTRFEIIDEDRNSTGSHPAADGQ